MTRDDIIRMAREVGYPLAEYDTGPYVPPLLEMFLKQAAAEEREECARVCDGVYHQHIGPAFGEVRYGIAACAAAIRARKDTQ